MKSLKKNVHLWPIGVIMGIFPMIIYLKINHFSMDGYAWFPSWYEPGDLFLYWRGICFLVLTGLTGIIFLDRILIQGCRIVWNKQMIPACLFLMMAFFSSVLSEHRDISFHGGYESYESIWMIAGYLAIMWMTVQLLATREDVFWLVSVLKVSAWILGFIGILQLLGTDILSSPFMGKIMTGGRLDGSLQFDAAYTAANKVYMTFYNSNYAGIYIILISPVIASELWREKGRRRWADGILEILLLVCLLGTGSKTALIAGAAELIMLAALFFRKTRRKTALFIGAAVTLIIFLLFICQHPIVTYFSQEQNQELSEQWMEDFSCGEDGVYLDYRGEHLYLSYGYTEDHYLRPVLYNGQGEEIRLDYYEESQRWGSYWAQGMLFRTIEAYDGSICLDVKYNDIYFEFRKIIGTDCFSYINQYGNVDENVRAETLFPNGSTFLHGRGYIWGRVIPLLKDHIILGSGADTFLYEFPQNDYAAKANMGKAFFNGFIKDAHSMYIQWMLYYGIIGSCCLWVFLALQWRQMKKKALNDPLSAGIWTGITGYLLCGITWSSSVSVAPIFWILLGCGMAITGKTDCR